jgi:hypothetical protein
VVYMQLTKNKEPCLQTGYTYIRAHMQELMQDYDSYCMLGEAFMQIQVGKPACASLSCLCGFCVAPLQETSKLLGVFSFWKGPARLICVSPLERDLKGCLGLNWARQPTSVEPRLVLCSSRKACGGSSCEHLHE